jgi:hypothetical protein
MGPVKSTIPEAGIHMTKYPLPTTKRENPITTHTINMHKLKHMESSMFLHAIWGHSPTQIHHKDCTYLA